MMESSSADVLPVPYWDLYLGKKLKEQNMIYLMGEDLQTARNTISMLVNDFKKMFLRILVNRRRILKKHKGLTVLLDIWAFSDIAQPTRWMKSSSLWINSNFVPLQEHRDRCKFWKNVVFCFVLLFSECGFLKSLCHRTGDPVIVQRFELFFFKLPNRKPAAFSQSSDY